MSGNVLQQMFSYLHDLPWSPLLFTPVSLHAHVFSFPVYACCHRCCLVCFAAKEPEYYFTQKLPQQYDVKRKKTASLECFVSDPRAFVKWYRMGEPLEVWSFIWTHSREWTVYIFLYFLCILRFFCFEIFIPHSPCSFLVATYVDPMSQSCASQAS